MTKEQAIRQFASHVLDETVVITRYRMSDGFNFSIAVSEAIPRLVIPKNLNCNFDEEDREFRRNFISRCPLARGFGNITIAILHECGHWATRNLMDFKTYDKMVEKAHGMKEYMEIPYEHLATEWAICWLHSPANRKLAKQFEREYFGYGND